MGISKRFYSPVHSLSLGTDFAVPKPGSLLVIKTAGLLCPNSCSTVYGVTKTTYTLPIPPELGNSLLQHTGSFPWHFFGTYMYLFQFLLKRGIVKVIETYPKMQQKWPSLSKYSAPHGLDLDQESKMSTAPLAHPALSKFQHGWLFSIQFPVRLWISHTPRPFESFA